jgi:parvulin-like peptidyl-prolyl isomerase
VPLFCLIGIILQMTRTLRTHTFSILCVLILSILAACTAPGGLNFQPSETPTPTITPTATATPIPLAITVNGQGISVPEFEAELARYQKAQSDLGNTVSLEDATKTVSDEIINQFLLAEGAAADGFTVDDAALQSRIDSLASQVGGPEGLTAWETQHGYTDESFRFELRLQMEAAYMRDKITSAVPTTADQVHVSQILLYNQDAAQQALDALKSGWTFPDLAAQYDPVTKGELGWIPKGYLPDPAVEEAVFALQPGQYSDIIHTQAGYDILYVQERDPNHPLAPDALLKLQENAVQDWLTQQRNTSKILFAP